MGTRLDFDIGACATLGGEAWKAIRSGGIVLTYGSVAGDSAGETGEVVHVVVGHVDEMQARVTVFKPGGERPLFSSDQEPVTTSVRLEAAEGLPLSVGRFEMVFQEMLAKHAPGEARGVVVGGGETIDLFIERNARVRWTVGDMDTEIRAALEEVVEEEVNASGSGLAGAGVRF